jgi:hypothetical protein
LTGLFTATVTLAAALFFAAQPLVARQFLPLLGGTPAVWTTCMLFFQAALVAGYVYAHALSTLHIRAQVATHASLVLMTLVWSGDPLRAMAGAIPPPRSSPTYWLLGRLVSTAGLPMLLIAATAPLAQRWFARLGRANSADPYFLYAASNLGSLTALLSYPLVIEPRMRIGEQARLWGFGLWALAPLLIACATAVGSRSRSRPTAQPWHAGAGRWVLWACLAFVPSSLMLGLTTFLSTDIAPVPLLWVIPLSLYLVSYIMAFSRRTIAAARKARVVFPLLVLLLTGVLCAGFVQPVWILLHLLTFFVTALVCHASLADRRPEVGGLTAYYLAIAVGGSMGGLFNSLVAPSIFDRLAEYPLTIVLACCVPALETKPRYADRRLRRALVLPLIVFLLAVPLVTNYRGLADTGFGVVAVMMLCGLIALALYASGTRPLQFALAIGALLLASGMSTGVDGRTVLRRRSFFGALRVTEAREPGSDNRVHRLFHGTTLHGQQCLDSSRRREPLTYFTTTGPIGDVFLVLDHRRGALSVAVVGLGAGTLAAYAQHGENWTFIEIDPAVVNVARDPRAFTYLRDSQAHSLDIMIGDGRVRVGAVADSSLDLIVLDAFGSDALPLHLLTREAVRLYLRKLKSGGLLAFNITNRYLDLDPVLAALARDEGLVCRIRHDVRVGRAEAEAGKQGSIWAVLATRPANIRSLIGDPRWVEPIGATADPAWTDDYAPLFHHFRLWPLRR